MGDIGVSLHQCFGIDRVNKTASVSLAPSTLDPVIRGELDVAATGLILSLAMVPSLSFERNLAYWKPSNKWELAIQANVASGMPDECVAGLPSVLHDLAVTSEGYTLDATDAIASSILNTLREHGIVERMQSDCDTLPRWSFTTLGKCLFMLDLIYMHRKSSLTLVGKVQLRN